MYTPFTTTKNRRRTIMIVKQSTWYIEWITNQSIAPYTDSWSSRILLCQSLLYVVLWLAKGPATMIAALISIVRVANFYFLYPKNTSYFDFINFFYPTFIKILYNEWISEYWDIKSFLEKFLFWSNLNHTYSKSIWFTWKLSMQVVI